MADVIRTDARGLRKEAAEVKAFADAELKRLERPTPAKANPMSPLEYLSTESSAAYLSLLNTKITAINALAVLNQQVK